MRIRNERGMTLVELLAAVAISAFLLSIAVLLVYSVNSMFNNQTNKYHDDTAARNTMENLKEMISISHEFTAYPAGAAHPVQWRFEQSFEVNKVKTQKYYAVVFQQTASGALPANSLLKYDLSALSATEANWQTIDLDPAAAPFEVIGTQISGAPAPEITSSNKLITVRMTFLYQDPNKRTYSGKNYEFSMKLLSY